ncbi:MAG: hypothetical protein SFU85_02430 [Candidatus Methylacidiphilales bacterium]|nr:hypothetical protein [Candidatus Methylacidiphilales bacterium]
MRLIRIMESYERGVFILEDSSGGGRKPVGPLGRLLGEADRLLRGQTASVLVLDRDREVRCCRRYRPGWPVEEEDPAAIRAGF